MVNGAGSDPLRSLPSRPRRRLAASRNSLAVFPVVFVSPLKSIEHGGFLFITPWSSGSVASIPKTWPWQSGFFLEHWNEASCRIIGVCVWGGVRDMIRMGRWLREVGWVRLDVCGKFSCVKDKKNIGMVSWHGRYGGVAAVRRTLSLILLRHNFSSLLLAGVPASGRTFDPHEWSQSVAQGLWSHSVHWCHCAAALALKPDKVKNKSACPRQ